MKTRELTKAALDWAVAKCEGLDALLDKSYPYDKVTGVWVNGFPEQKLYSPSTDWSQGGPIIEREKISIDYDRDIWNASKSDQSAYYQGDTPLEAAMRCYVASKLGDEVEIPEELL